MQFKYNFKSQKMTHRFVVNTDDLNEYGYRVLTEGIDTSQYEKNPVVYYMHSRNTNNPTGREVVGRTVNLEKEPGKLFADIEFDMEDEFAKIIAGKVERGFVRMASIYADVKATSSDEKDLLPGQQYETVTKSKLVELSVVDIGGNDAALKLSKNGNPIQLKKINLNNNTTKMELKTIALAMGLPQDANEDALLSEAKRLQDENKTLKSEKIALSKRIEDIESSEAVTLVDKAIALGLIDKALRETTLQSFTNDFEGQKVLLTKLISEKEEDNGQAERTATITEVVLGKGKGKQEVKLTYDYLQKYDTAELRRIHDEEPEFYAKLAKDYANGVREK